MGYKNATITLTFPELSEDGDDIWVKIRNPKILTTDSLGDSPELSGPAFVEDPAPGETPEQAQERLDRNHKRAAARARENDVVLMNGSRDRLARLVVDWHVYSVATGALLDLPATADGVRQLPLEIITKISEALSGGVNPQ